MERVVLDCEVLLVQAGEIAAQSDLPRMLLKESRGLYRGGTCQNDEAKGQR